MTSKAGGVVAVALSVADKLELVGVEDVEPEDDPEDDVRLAWASRATADVDAESVALTRGDTEEVAVPDVAVDLGQLDAGLTAVPVDQTQVDTLGHLREQREIGAGPVVRGAEGEGATGPGTNELWGGLLRVVVGHNAQQ